MSYILDALKKSERERTLVRGIGFGDAARRGSRNAGRSLWWLGLIVILLAAAIFVATWIRTRIADRAPAPTSMSIATQESPTPRATDAGRAPSGDGDAAFDAGVRGGRIRFLSAMAPEFQRSVPAMTVNIHVYAPRESQRIAYINNRQVRRGDEIAGGVFVEDIAADGVVLQFRAQRFKLPRPS